MDAPNRPAGHTGEQIWTYVRSYVRPSPSAQQRTKPSEMGQWQVLQSKVLQTLADHPRIPGSSFRKDCRLRKNAAVH